MISDLVLALLLVHSAVVAAYSPPANTSINWYPCKQNGTAPYECGSLAVPLDYTDAASNKTLNLDLVKVSATKQPKKGSILFNPGGPGDGGRNFVAVFAKILVVVTGGAYDLIGFDPRYVTSCDDREMLQSCTLRSESYKHGLSLCR